MADNIPKAPEGWRNFSDKVPLAAMVLRKGDLKKLYKIINDKQIEFRDRFMPVLALQPNEPPDEFEARKKRLYDSFVTSMTIHRLNGEYLHGNNEAFLGEDNLPDRIRSIFFTTSTVPAALGIAPVNKIVVFLDFTRSPLFDFSRMPSLPTPNESNFEVASDNELLFAGARSRLIDFFNNRTTRVNWLHAGAIYDVGLYILGFPVAIWATYHVSRALEAAPKLPTVITSAIYIYIFFAALNLFRVFFLYSRWVFPKVELESERSSPFRHRAVWAGLTIATLGGVIWDAVKLIFAN
ncbi:MAG: hypothetical protein ACLPID_18155 [Beijerinckiaceae bacterium]